MATPMGVAGGGARCTSGHTHGCSRGRARCSRGVVSVGQWNGREREEEEERQCME